MKRIFCLLLLSLAGSLSLKAQDTQTQEESRVKFALSTNALDWANYGTANLELGVGVARHFSLHAGIKYNPWEFTAKDLGIPVRNNQTTAFVGARFWPWYVLSGWWVGAKVQYSDYEKTGLWRPALEQGVKVGGGLSFGYTLMIHKYLNIEFGAGVWGGSQLKYDLYCCTNCMEVRSTGKRGFFGLDDASVSLMFVF